MLDIKRYALSTLLLLGTAQCAPQRYNDTSLLKSTSLRLLYQNNLNASDDQNHGGAILLDPMTRGEGEAACKSLDESLIHKETLQNYSSDYFYLLSHVEAAGWVGEDQQFWTQDGVVTMDSKAKSVQFPARDTHKGLDLPILCSQTSRANGPDANATARVEVEVPVDNNVFIGFRNQKSFRFQGIRYANTPERFEYSTVYDKTGQTVDATKYGANCLNTVGQGSEDCLFLNIQTPYIPKAGSNKKLLPVLFSIHGGDFVSGDGRGTSGQDGGNLASREDIVSVQINYRLGTLGFLALNGTELNGNYGIGDQVTALQWVKKHIAAFGGDPDRVTIAGASAGAGSVRALLGSPPVIKSKLIAGAIAQSNPGGGVTLGLTENHGTTYSSYLTIAGSAQLAGEQIFAEAGCNQTDISGKIQCLKEFPAEKLAQFTNVARYVVQDGYFVDTEQLIVNTKNASTAHVPIIFGVNANDGASIASSYPKTPVTTLSEGIQQSLSISIDQAQRVIDSGLFPLYNTGNLTLDAFNVSQRIATDITFRCIDEATVYAGAHSGAFPATYYYEFDRTYQGYDPSNLGTNLTAGPAELDHPYGNPNKPYFRLHGAEGGFTYGVQTPLRDRDDLLASQLISSYIAHFVKTGDPNRDVDYLRVRGYTDVLTQIEKSGRWEPVSNERGPAKSLDVVSRTIDFPELEQCKWLNYTVSYYLDGGA
ncbi:Putative carboxylesterase, type B, carboxylesterase type B, active, alpha/Beta hydrolase [Septoria linicola]|uniref:Carboxylesterase, type B, carboxylesterase type B, active, alpha/Beta hydrolase n=1 Tax=Septoria linicola TaxID=215465 RepID=A0A9Q9EPL8_9PEZI|nr:Putative carboxylesterase, type B, carboxylesterase type B, active, alpha/Beta hydrolase [Septoria linicola]